MQFPRLGRMPRTLAPQPLGTPLRPYVSGRTPARRGFTLVELLVVITIIGILASLITVAAANALWNARQTQIKIELDNLDAAMKGLKAETGSYPPCNLTFTASQTNPSAADFNLPLKQYIATRFPRYRQTANDGTYSKLATDLTNAGVSVTNFDPARALVFWLSPFNADVTQPFLINDTVTQTKALFDFERTRLIQRGAANYLVYVPPKGKDVPYVYFDSGNYGTLDNSAGGKYGVLSNVQGTAFYKDPTGGDVVPYAQDVNGSRALDATDAFANRDSCQIISAGQDGQFGASGLSAPYPVRLYPAGVNYDAGGNENDNIVNFSDKNNLDAARP